MSDSPAPSTPPPEDPSTTAGQTESSADERVLAELADDFAARLRRGEHVTVDDYAVQHPQLEDRIRNVLPAIAMLEESRAAGTIALVASEGPGSILGRYKLLERIGEGGFGVVFMAEQQNPVRRRVALKLIKPGVDTRQVIARFEAERQALALMDHENIAKVLDAGATDTGRPYFVMELVHGVPITDYCDANQLAPRQRLELFVQVCRAVQHAHTKGIIHRDIKPSNVLVTLHEGVAVPKVIDFGVAKATGQQLTEKTLFTNFAQMVGTPLYMSPEQAEMTSVDVDTRSDVYSLGVLLYELLTGTTPLDKVRLKQAAFDEVRRIIREEDPPKPSTRLSTMGDKARRTVCAQRGSDPKHLGRLVRGELDWIVMKALEKERSRRYETANGLARDVERYLQDAPVEACPPSTTYRLGKFVRRNKGPAVAAMIVLLTLIGGIAGTTIGLARAERARRAEVERAEGERRAKESAVKRLAQVERGIELLGAIFDDLDPMAEAKEGRPLRAIIGDRLDSVAARLDESVGDPLDIARLQDRLGRTYLSLGGAAKAEALFAQVLATRKAHLGPEHPLTLESASHQALAYHEVGKRKEAIALFEQVRDAQLRVLGPGDPATLTTLTALAQEYWLSDQPARAVVVLEQVRDERVKLLGIDHDDTLATLHRLAGVYLALGKFPEAIAMAEGVYETRHRKLGADHPLTIEAKHSLANVHRGAGKMRKALVLLEEVCAAAEVKLGANHPSTLVMQSNLAWTYRAFGRLPEAIALAEKVLELQRKVVGPDHPQTLMTLWNLSLAYRAAAQPEKALLLLEQAAAGVEKMGFSHTETENIVERLCSRYEELGQWEKAENWRRKWLAVLKETKGPASLKYAAELEDLGMNLIQQNRHVEAEAVLRECLAIREATLPGRDGSVEMSIARGRYCLGAALLCQKKFAEAEPHLVYCYDFMSKAASASTPAHLDQKADGVANDTLGLLIQLYDQWNKPDRAAHYRGQLDARRGK